MTYSEIKNKIAKYTAIGFSQKEAVQAIRDTASRKPANEKSYREMNGRLVAEGKKQMHIVTPK